MTLTPRLALLMIVPPLMWAGNAVVGRMAIADIGPIWLNLLRWVLAGLILLPLGWRAIASRAAWRAIGQRWRHLALLSLTGVGLYNTLQYLALRTSTPINVTLISASAPVWMLSIGALFYGVRPTLRQGLGALLSLLGVGLVLSRGSWTAWSRLQLLPGDLLMLAAVLAWCTYSWLLARPPASMQGQARPDWNWAGFLLVQVVLGLGWAGTSAALGDLLWMDQPIRWSPLLLAALAFVAIGPSVLAYRCWGLGVVQAGPAVAAFFANLTPLFAALMSAALLGEPPRPYHGLAFALIVGGILVSSLGQREATAAPRGKP